MLFVGPTCSEKNALNKALQMSLTSYSSEDKVCCLGIKNLCGLNFAKSWFSEAAPTYLTSITPSPVNQFSAVTYQ